MKTLGVAIAISLTLATSTGAKPKSDVAAANSEKQCKKQLVSVGNIIAIYLIIEIYREDHTSAPPNLESLYEYAGNDKFFRDGWDRPFYYYSSGQEYVLISFGKDGKPRKQASDPGGLTAKIDYDDDIVIVNGEFAQKPYGCFSWQGRITKFSS